MEQRAPRSRRRGAASAPEPVPEVALVNPAATQNWDELEDWDDGGAAQYESGSDSGSDNFSERSEHARDGVDGTGLESWADSRLQIGDDEVTVVSVGGRQYRKRRVAYSRAKAMTWDTPQTATNNYGDGPNCGAVEQMTGSFECASQFLGFFVGRNGVQRKRLEEETGCTLTIPRPSGVARQCTLGITGPTEAAVESCTNRLQILAVSAKQALPPTHFLSLPLSLNASIRDQFSSLREEVIAVGDEESKGFQASMVTATERFHLTLGVMKLFTPADIDAARFLLDQARQEMLTSLYGNSDQAVDRETISIELVSVAVAAASGIYVSVASWPSRLIWLNAGGNRVHER